MKALRPVLWCVLAVLAARQNPLAAQAIEVRAGRLWDSTGWATYRVGVSRPLTDVFGVSLHGDYSARSGSGSGRMAGIGADVTAFRNRSGGPYMVAGLSGGMGSASSDSYSDPWGSWSAGAGYDLFPLDFMSVAAEGRWRALTLGGGDGFELALGVSFHLDRGPPERPASEPVTPLPLLDHQSPPQNLADSVIATATQAMGRPYVYGGTGAQGGGFDCSGLIQYAYGKHGIELPRQSRDQAREGSKVDRDLKDLRPADLLTFSNSGGPVTHVGMYIGEGRFIHSATHGVQVSTLSASDPYGRWWYRRWVGVRRIISKAH